MQSAEQSQLLTGFFWLAVIVFLAVIAAAALVALRRRLWGSLPNRRPSFTLEQLRRLRDEGRLHPDEFKALVARLGDETDPLRGVGKLRGTDSVD